MNDKDFQEKVSKILGSEMEEINRTSDEELETLNREAVRWAAYMTTHDLAAVCLVGLDRNTGAPNICYHAGAGPKEVRAIADVLEEVSKGLKSGEMKITGIRSPIPRQNRANPASGQHPPTGNPPSGTNGGTVH